MRERVHVYRTGNAARWVVGVGGAVLIVASIVAVVEPTAEGRTDQLWLPAAIAVASAALIVRSWFVGVWLLPESGVLIRSWFVRTLLARADVVDVYSSKWEGTFFSNSGFDGLRVLEFRLASEREWVADAMLATRSVSVRQVEQIREHLGPR
jgi:hypothetical protein